MFQAVKTVTRMYLPIVRFRWLEMLRAFSLPLFLLPAAVLH